MFSLMSLGGVILTPALFVKGKIWPLSLEIENPKILPSNN